MKKTIDLLVYCLICQKCLKGYKQIYSLIENKSSPYLCSFRKNQNAKRKLWNHADYNTLYKSGKNMQKIKKRSGNGFHDFTQMVS